MIQGTPHLTIANPVQSVRETATAPGMMGWAGTGPSNATCYECQFFRQRYVKKTQANKDIPREGRCRKFIRIMRSRNGSASVYWIPPETPACRHFEKPEIK